MIKKAPFWIFALIFICSIGWAAGELELTAPGGGEMDLDQNVVKYYGTDSKQIEARWGEYLLVADYLEYYRSQSLIIAKGRVQMYQNSLEKRSVQAVEIKFEINKNILIARDAVIQMDKTMRAKGGYLEWDRVNDRFKLTERPQVNYEDWALTGKIIEGQPKQGLLTITGEVHGESKDTILKAGKLIAERDPGLFYLQDNPVIIRGKNELSATEIIYNLKTKKVTAKGSMKSKITE